MSNSIIKVQNLKKYFEHIFISGEYGRGKPAQEMFKAAIRIFKCPAKDFIMIGNSLRSDIQGAANLGMKTIWINRGGEGNNTEINADYEIKSLDQVFGIIEDI